jgi:hypothetical protein
VELLIASPDRPHWPARKETATTTIITFAQGIGIGFTIRLAAPCPTCQRRAALRAVAHRRGDQALCERRRS